MPEANEAHRPTEMVWKCDGYRIRMDEDGVGLFLDRTGYEQQEVAEMFATWDAIVQARADDYRFAIPIPPTSGTRWDDGVKFAAKRAKIAVGEALIHEFGATTDEEVPF